MGRELLIRLENKKVLSEFAKQITNLLRGENLEKRESNFYTSGYYFKFRTKKNEVSVYEADSEKFVDFDFSVYFKNDEPLLNLTLKSLAENLISPGDEVAIPESPLIDAKTEFCRKDRLGQIEWVII
ncbi:hypothetical protein LEP1GSC047_0387 [Leptospira inadai serovar Lyme str. 10]|uniref:Uncharacterized protein n=2 Tax=Leptospira inadai serovar Lyme TaxID=293084 RepID=V6H9N0_9LEPT|nr:hypothetical protein [Leptospira inadai]EQA35732.1 hypothetical protein LEP1GSC047_0387 [Leptospira inadai serovar Lyme str. 10]PNV76876.1 hypothetical protein BES34_000930 [Leptospira inadai serovar Lyme]